MRSLGRAKIRGLLKRLSEISYVKRKENPIDLASRMAYIRELRGYSQDALAKIVGTSQQQIGRIESGLISRPRNIERIASVLQVSAAWLLYGHEELDNLSKEAIDMALKFETLTDAQKEVFLAQMDAVAKKKPRQ